MLAINNQQKDFLCQDFTNLLKKNDNEFDVLQSVNINIGKYLLSLFYYKDIILSERGFRSYLKSAEKGDPKAQYDLGNCYYDGRGVSQDYKKAFKWYLKSANGGCAEGQCSLGYCYENGFGIDKDYKKAFEWYLKSATLGSAMAKNNLGNCYQYGHGVERDYA